MIAMLSGTSAGSPTELRTMNAPRRSIVTSWKILIGGSTLTAGDYFYTEPGEVHDVLAIEDSVIYVASEKPVTVLDK